MEQDEKFVVEDREYTREELLIFGQQHYPKFYWIKRGVGLWLMSLGIMGALICVVLGISVSLNSNLPNSQNDAIGWYIGTAPFAVLVIAGIILIALSFKKLPDESYIKHAKDYLNKEALRRKQRETRNAQRQEKQDVNQLIKYKKLLDAGVITQEEYEAKKKELL